MLVLRYTALAVVYFVFSTYTQAQIQNPTVSAAAFAYGQYADIPVSHHTGTGNVTVPLHTITDGPLSLPISLNYHSAGNLVSVPSSSVGLGWNLHVGGMISRSIKGLADETEDYGYYEHGGKDRSRADDHRYDMEPDMFTYSIGDQNGKFFIDGNRDVQMVPRSDIKIELIVVSHSIKGLIATLPSGVKYHFGVYTSPSDNTRSASDTRSNLDVALPG